MSPDKKSKYKKHFRRMSHPRKKLQLPEESITYLKSKNSAVPDVSPYSVLTELINYYDIFDTGLDIGDKTIRHSENRDNFNQIFFDWRKKPLAIETNRFARKSWREYCQSKKKHIDDTKLNLDKIYDHITKQKLIYGTMNPFSPIRVLGGDIDNETDDPTVVLPFLHLFQSFYPRSFYDGGSSGKSLHYYPKIDMLPLYEYYRNTSISDKWATYANKIIGHTGHIFKIYGTNILCPEHTLELKTLTSGKTRYKPKYNVKFDAFKASYPVYDFYRDDDGTPHPTKMIKNGVLHKLPNIFTVGDLLTFRDAPVYSIIYHLSVSVYLCNSILLSGCYSEKQYKDLTTALKEIEPILIAHSVLLPDKAKNIVALIPKDSSERQVPFNTTGEEEYNKELCVYTGTFENVADIALESDAMLRSRRYLYYCFVKYIIEEGREPTIEEYIQDYRQDVGTGEENQEDRRRLEYIYHTNVSKMRKYLFGSLSQKIEMMENKLGLEQEGIDRMSTYYRKLWKREVAITAVWIELCLCNADYIEKKKWWSLSKGEHYSRELTVPMTSLENFIKCLKEKGLNKNGCNPRKAKALRELLIDMQWMQCVDDSVIIAAHNDDNKGGRARRYILLLSHPGYKKFENIVGSDRIEYWKQFRQEQLRIRTAKIRKRRVG